MPQKGKKLPKWFWVVGIGAAILIGLYLRNRGSSSQKATSSQSTSTGGATDVTSNPYFYTNSGAYPDPYGFGNSSPYGVGSLAGNNWLPSGFDPTSFEEGISYQQSQGFQTLPNWLTPDQAAQVGASLGAPVPTTANGGTPAQITINVTPHTTGRKPGQPNHSGRRHKNGRQAKGGYWTDSGYHSGKPPGHNAVGGTLGAWQAPKKGKKHAKR